MISLRDINIELSRRSFWEYCKTREPEFYKDSRPHLKKLCTTLDDFLCGRLLKEDGEAFTKLMIRLPPQHGKSRTLVNFTQWALGKNNNERIITASYGDGPATDFSRYTRDGINEIANTPEQIVFSDVFPHTKIKQGNSSVQKWALEGQHFNYLGVGYGGGVTGKGATLRIIDDLVKDIEVAINDTALDKIWRWLSGTFSSRNASEGGEVKEIFCATLWSDNDPQAILEKTEGDDWFILAMPIYDEDNDKMLCDDMMNFKSFQKLKKRMLIDNTSKLVFYANYMCVAYPDDENSIYTDDSLQKYTELPKDANGNLDGWMLAAIDPADEGKDYYSAPFGLVSGNDVYIVDAIFNQNNIDLNLVELEEAHKVHKFAGIYVETNNVGAKHARDIKRKILGSAYGAWSSTNKMGRIINQAQTVKSHFYFPENPSPTLRRFMKSLIRLKKTSKKDDDAADAISMMANYLNTRYGLFKD